jgi:hypothetical protein
MGQAKMRKKLGIYPTQVHGKTFTVGIVATDWTESPRYKLATAMFTILPDDADLQRSVAELQGKFTLGQLVNAMQECFEKDMMITHQSLFGAVVMAYVTQTQTYSLARRQGATGMWLKLMSRKDEGKEPLIKARPFGAFAGDDVAALMNRVRNKTITDEEWSMFVYSDHLDDQPIVAFAVQKDGKVVDMNGHEFMAQTWSGGKTDFGKLMQEVMRTIH